MKPGDSVKYTTKDFRRNGTVYNTSEGIFMGFCGKRSCKIQFTKKDGSKLIATVLVEKLNKAKESA